MSGAGAERQTDTGERLDRLVHDLRTPLTIISGFADLLERHREKLTEVQRDEYVQRIAAAADDLRRILDEERESRATGA